MNQKQQQSVGTSGALQPNPTSVLKKIAMNMESNRKAFEAELSGGSQGEGAGSGSIPANNSLINSHRQTFNQLEPLIRSQTSAIDSIRQFSKESVSETSKNLESKRLYMQMFEHAVGQIKAYMDIAQEMFLPSYKASMLQGEGGQQGKKGGQQQQTSNKKGAMTAEKGEKVSNEKGGNGEKEKISSEKEKEDITANQQEDQNSVSHQQGEKVLIVPPLTQPRPAKHSTTSSLTPSQLHWNKLSKELEKNLTSLYEESLQSPNNMFHSLIKLSQIKESFNVQILRLMIYQKNVLWRDLNAPYDDYVHGDVKAIINEIKQNEEKLGYVPGKLKYEPVRFEALGWAEVGKGSGTGIGTGTGTGSGTGSGSGSGTSTGTANPNNNYAECDYLQLMRIHMNDFAEISEGLKNYSKLNGEPQIIEDISKNQHIVKGLRERIEKLTINYENLMDKYRSLQISKGVGGSFPTGNSSTSGFHSNTTTAEEKSLHDRIEDMETYIIKKEQEVLELRQQTLKSDTTIQSLKDKNRELEDELSKFQKYQQPKIKELETNQKNILDEFGKVKRDLETYTNIVAAERDEKQKLVEDLECERKRVGELAFILGRERRKIKEMKGELVRKEQIIMELVDGLGEGVGSGIIKRYASRGNENKSREKGAVGIGSTIKKEAVSLGIAGGGGNGRSEGISRNSSSLTASLGANTVGMDTKKVSSKVELSSSSSVVNKE